MFLASKISAAGTVALGLAGYLAGLVPGLPPRAVAVVAILAFTVLNYFGVRRSSRANLAIVAVSLGSLLLFVALGASAFQAENLRPFAPRGWRGVLEASAILFFAYTGYARIATLGEEVHEPRRTIPRAVVITIAGAILLYLAVGLVAVGSAGAGAMSATPAPLRVAPARTGYPWLPAVVSVGGLTAMLGVILSQVLGLSRMAFAMARRGDLPRFLAHVHPDSAVPRHAVLVVGGIAALVAATGTLGGVAAVASFTILVYYGIANVAALRMPREAKLYPDAVPWTGLLVCALLAFSLAPWTIAAGTVVLAAGFGARWLARYAAGRGA
jgi:APA family basic amino acid/polyamine antiporter